MTNILKKTFNNNKDVSTVVKEATDKIRDTAAYKWVRDTAIGLALQYDVANTSDKEYGRRARKLRQQQIDEDLAKAATRPIKKSHVVDSATMLDKYLSESQDKDFIFVKTPADIAVIPKKLNYFFNNSLISENRFDGSPLDLPLGRVNPSISMHLHFTNNQYFSLENEAQHSRSNLFAWDFEEFKQNLKNANIAIAEPLFHPNYLSNFSEDEKHTLALGVKRDIERINGYRIWSEQDREEIGFDIATTIQRAEHANDLIANKVTGEDAMISEHATMALIRSNMRFGHELSVASQYNPKTDIHFPQEVYELSLVDEKKLENLDVNAENSSINFGGTTNEY